MFLNTKIFIIILTLNSIKTCLKGDTNCARCAGSYCQKCFGAYSSSGGCAKPSLEISNCLSYKSSTQCEMCNFGY